MPEKRKKYDREFREGAVRIVNETNKSVAAVARELGVNEGTLGNWVTRDREGRQGTEGLSKGDIEELKQCRLAVEEAQIQFHVADLEWLGRAGQLEAAGSGVDRRLAEGGAAGSDPDDALIG